RRGVTARRRRNQGRLRALQALRAARRDERKRPGALAMTAADGAVSGKTVIEAKAIAKAFGARTIVKDFTLRIQRGDRIGIVGPNGAGKTTLLALLTGALAPDEGRVGLGTNLEIVTLDQGRASLDPAASLAAMLTGGRGDSVIAGGTARHVIGYMKDFLFAPEQAETPVGALSGGERARLMLARALARPANLLVLDEPTNDLDLETLDLLQELVAEHAGTVLLVSHDRDFLDRTVTAILYGAGDGTWIEYAGGYADMVAQRGAGVATRADALAAKQKAALRAPAAERAPRVRKGLSFKEKHALETLPGRIRDLEATIVRLGAALADPALYGRDPARFRDAADALAAARAGLAVAEEEWLALEIKREAEA
ncbi:MAG: ATP-binding cassette domain-containing protein, partial [Alphaproteobacteria bacterium]|nr:ATP-binding cassette domain-containing protein [Alphaproteobacteria bacterium]